MRDTMPRLSEKIREARGTETRPIFLAKHGFECNPQTAYRWEVEGVIDPKWIPAILDAIDADPKTAVEAFADAIAIDDDEAEGFLDFVALADKDEDTARNAARKIVAAYLGISIEAVARWAARSVG